MSGSESENENFCFFGTPLDPYDEDAFPKKKPFSVEEQIATDAQGRRRFHGAFTGGFSAGFFNTVGSLEGWRPREFKSTRQEKAQNKLQKPEDFMDDEDLGEFGFAHQTVRATNEYSSSKKRKKQVFTDGPIPGEPVLHTLLTSGNETVGYLLLKNIGIQEKIQKNSEPSMSEASEGKVYGCQMPKSYQVSENIMSHKQYEIPLIYKECLSNPKHNTFGLGYEGLDKSHLNLFQSSDLVVTDKNNKKLSIRGQAFGVGAFEEDDDDIYVKDDMSKYDFEMLEEKKLKKVEKKGLNLLFDQFVSVKTPLTKKKVYPAPSIPHSFTGKHKVKKSRFEPLEEELVEVKRGSINPAVRAKYLGENSKPVIPEPKNDAKPNEKEAPNRTDRTNEPSSSDKPKFDLAAALLSDRFVSSSQNENVSSILETVQKMETEHGTEQMRAAAKMKMFGTLTRISVQWRPCALLCKRFNVPEPMADRPESSRKRSKNLIFEYQKHSEDQNDLTPGLSIQKINNIEEAEGNSACSSSGVVGVNDSPSITEDVTLQVKPETLITPTKENVEENREIKVDNIKEDVEIDENLSKDITEKVNIEENIDLFKAVFLSSSEESENEEMEESKTLQKEAEESKRNEELKVNVLSEPLILKIKPLKQGILSNVDFRPIFSKPSTSTDKIEEKTVTVEKNDEAKIEEKVNLYGPKVPDKLPEKLELNSKQVTISSDSDDEWIEKGKKDKKKKHKKEKKHKKSKHKKHKHSKA